MRIAFVVSHPIQNQVPLYRGLSRRSGVELRVYFGDDAGARPRYDRGFAREVAWDIPLLEGYLHELLPSGPRGDVALIRRLRAFDPQVIVIHGYVHARHQVVLAFARIAQIPVLLRGDSHALAPRPAWKRAVKRGVFAWLRWTVAGALAAGTLSARYWALQGFPRERIFWAPNSVDNGFFRAQAEATRARASAWRASLGVAADEPVALFAGKLVASKGVETLIAAFAQADVAGSALIVVGDGPERARYEALANRHPGAMIRFAGFVNQSEMPAAYAMGELLVLPSLHEAWGLVVNEAMNLGLAVCVSDHVGCGPDLVGEDNGWVFPAGDVDALAAVLREALSDRARLARMGEASLARIAEWDVSATVDGVLGAAAAVVDRAR